MQQQKVLAAGVQLYDRTDYNDFLFIGYPKDGQTLEEVKELGLQEIAKLRAGDFDEKHFPIRYASLNRTSRKADQSRF